MRDFLLRRFQKGYRTFVIDLELCPGVDSTFIGMLYALAKQLAQVDQSGTVELINASSRNERSIRKLGLDNRILIDTEGSRWQQERALVRENLRLPSDCPPMSKRERAEMVLEAHEALITANEENEKRFCDVVEFLRRELDEEEAATAGREPAAPDPCATSHRESR
jgi:anti-anti-sigma regulatory factor